MARILLDAICSGNVSLATEIINDEAYRGVDSQTSRRDGTALFFSCSRGYLDLAILLLRKNANVNARNKCQATPLHAAADNNHLRIVKLLLDQGANINAQTHRGDTALHLAAFRGHADIAQCLVEHGADFLLANESNVTAAVEAMVQGHPEVGEYLKAVKDLYGQPRSVMTLEPSSDRMVFLNAPSKGRSSSQPSSPAHQHQPIGAFSSPLLRGLSFPNNHNNNNVSMDAVGLPTFDSSLHANNNDDTCVVGTGESDRRQTVLTQEDNINNPSRGRKTQIICPDNALSAEPPWSLTLTNKDTYINGNHAGGQEQMTNGQTATSPSVFSTTNQHNTQSIINSRKNPQRLSIMAPFPANPHDVATSRPTGSTPVSQQHQRKHYSNNPSIPEVSDPRVNLFTPYNQNHHYHSYYDDGHKHRQHNNNDLHNNHFQQRPLTPVFFHDDSTQINPTSIIHRSRSPTASISREPEESIDTSMIIYSPPSINTQSNKSPTRTRTINQLNVPKNKLSTSSSPSFSDSLSTPDRKDITPNPNTNSPTRYPSPKEVTCQSQSSQNVEGNGGEACGTTSVPSNARLRADGQTQTSLLSTGSDGPNSTTSSFNGDGRHGDDFDLLPLHLHLPQQHDDENFHHHHQHHHCHPLHHQHQQHQQEERPQHHRQHRPQEQDYETETRSQHKQHLNSNDNNRFKNNITPNHFHTSPRSPHACQPSSSSSTQSPFFQRVGTTSTTTSTTSSQPQQPFTFQRLPSTPSSIASLDLADSGISNFESSTTQPSPANQIRGHNSLRSNSPMSVETLPQELSACARDSLNGSAFGSMETSATNHHSGVEMGKPGDSADQDLSSNGKMNTSPSPEHTHGSISVLQERSHGQEPGREWDMRSRSHPGNSDPTTMGIFRPNCNVFNNDRVSSNRVSLLNDLSSSSTPRPPNHSLNYSLNIPVGST